MTERAKALGTRALVGVAGVALSFAIAAPAHADAIDEAYARGGEAAAREDWSSAAHAYEQARAISVQRSAQLSYDLGTAYANLGELGFATYHLERALNDPAGADAKLSEQARRNLAIVRRRLELHAAGAGLQLSEPADWRDALVGVLCSSVFAGFGLLLGIGAMAAAGLRSLGRAKSQTTAVAFACALGFAVVSVAHVSARSSDRATAPSIVLTKQVEVREGPGDHTPLAFNMSGGSRVWVRERRSGWASVQSLSGLVGWVREAEIGALDAPVGAISPSPKAGEASPKTQDSGA